MNQGPVQQGMDAGQEWLELLNIRAWPINLANWQIRDNAGADFLPPLTLAPDGLAVVVGNEADFLQNFPDFDGLLVAIADGKIGNGLANGGDRLLIFGPDGSETDALSYGDDTSVFAPPVLDVPAGHCGLHPILKRGCGIIVLKRVRRCSHENTIAC